MFKTPIRFTRHGWSAFRRRFAATAVLIAVCVAGLPAIAASPALIAQGKVLFEKNWSPQNPSFGSDGLGPLFNARSCVACHHQGGVGGGGDARFNAKTLGIEELEIVGANGSRVNNDVVARMISLFHPGFANSNGAVIDTVPIAHNGGSSTFDQSRKAFLNELPAEFSSQGGPRNASEVRQASGVPILRTIWQGPYRMTVRVRLFQRNTTALFGAGLVDQVTEGDLDKVVRAQKRHPEISGRPATLRDGRYGRFGWRGNVARLAEFCDQACANELGLETKRMPQATDPTLPGYRNPSFDVQDSQIQAMADFVAALPAPRVEVPEDPLARQDAERGQRLFASVGCAVCHVPNLGPAQGLYSDLLLHDMGPELVDSSHAEPYRKRYDAVSPNDRATLIADMQRIGSEDPTLHFTNPYYGEPTLVSVSSPKRRFYFAPPTRPRTTVQYLDGSYGTPEVFNPREITSGERRSRSSLTSDGILIRTQVEPTNFAQEWRTPPLWGLRDSAPYMHDGRAETVLEAIAMHDGEAAGTRDRFLMLSVEDRRAVLAFLDTLVAPKNVPQPSPDQIAAE